MGKKVWLWGIMTVAIFLLSQLALGWAASSIPGLTVDPASPHGMAAAFITAIGFNGAAFVGCIVYLSKKYMTKVDQISEMTPELIQTLRAMKESLESNSESIKEHYGSLEEQGKQIVQINTIHRLRGCDQSVKRGGE